MKKSFFNATMAALLGGSGPANIILPALSSLAGFGDSIIYGYSLGASGNRFAAALRWLNIVGTALGVATPLNQGIAGTVLQNSIDSGGSPRANNGRDRFVADLLGANLQNGIALAYGFNDARYTGAPATLNVSNYGIQLRQIISGLIIGGYNPNKIFIVGIYWISDTGLVTGSAGFTGQTRSGFEAYVNDCKAAAAEYGVWYADTYNAMINGGGSALIDPADNIHPTAAGQALIAQNALYNSYLQNPYAVPVVTATAGSGSINYSITAVAGAISYTVQYGNDGTYSYPNTQDVSASGNISGVSSGTYRTRARANFGDGSSTPWGFVTGTISVTAPGIFLQQSFADTPGKTITATVPTIGGAWSLQSGSSPASPVAINAGGTALYSPAAPAIYVNSAAPSSADYYVEIVIDKASVVTNDSVGVEWRCDPFSNTAYFARYSNTSNTWGMFKVVAGVTTQLGTNHADVWVSGSRTLRGSAVGTTISFSVTAVVLESLTDNSISSANNVGLRFGAAQTSSTGMNIASVVAST